MLIFLTGCSPGSGTIQLGNAAKAKDSSGCYSVPEKLISAWEESFSGSLYTPIVFGDRIMVGDKSGKIYVLNTATGSKLSELKYKGLLCIAPVVSGDTAVFYGIYDEKKVTTIIYRYLPVSKTEEKWAELPGAVSALVLIPGNRVAVISGKLLYLLNKGNPPEKYPLSNFAIEIVADKNGRLFVLVESNQLFVFNKEKKENGLLIDKDIVDIFLYNDSVYVEKAAVSKLSVVNSFNPIKVLLTEGDGKLKRYLLNLSPQFVLTGGGNDTIRISTPDYYTIPLLLNSGIITAGATGNVYYYKFQSGNPVVLQNFGERISAKPVLAGNMLILCGEEGTIRAYPMVKGKGLFQGN